LLDALVLQKPESAAFRQAAASLNGAYAGAFVKDSARAATMTDKALTYAVEALCLEHEALCDARKLPLDEFKQRLAELEADDVPLLYTAGVGVGGLDSSTQ
jgi:hypothetical protein